MQTFKVTLSVPCYLRPRRTIRAIEAIAAQDINGWQALVSGDGCPDLQRYIESGYFSDIVHDCGKRGNLLCIQNYPTNRGGYGYAVTNENIKSARGLYFAFFANDDVILPNHLRNYLSEIENTDLDFVYFNSIVEARGDIRNSTLSFGGVGHSELIIKTDFLKRMPPHTDEYGHDWRLIQNMLKAGALYKKSKNQPTYIVKSIASQREEGID